MSTLIPVKLKRKSWELIIEALRGADGFGDEHTDSTLVKMEVVSQLDTFCDSTAGRHVMIRPEDTKQIIWGEFGICTECYIIRKLPVNFRE